MVITKQHAIRIVRHVLTQEERTHLIKEAVQTIEMEDGGVGLGYLRLEPMTAGRVNLKGPASRVASVLLECPEVA